MKAQSQGQRRGAVCQKSRISTLRRVRRAAVWLLLTVAGTILGHQPSQALDYPNRPVHVIVPFSAGGAPDIVIRVLGQALGEKWGQSVIIENRPGANTFIGTVAVARSAPDGYTLLFTADGTFILNPLLYPSMPYSMKELQPITLVASTPHVLVISNKVEAHTVKEFIALAKAKPGSMTFGSTGPGSIQRLAFEHFSRLTGINLVHVPYRGASETVNALLAGQVDASINGLATVQSLMQAGKVRVLAITTKQRSSLAPDMPTIGEAGVPGFSSAGLFGLMAPAGVPQDIREKIERDIGEVLARPAIKTLLAARSFEPAPMGPEKFEAVIAEESDKWRKVIVDKNIKVE